MGLPSVSDFDKIKGAKKGKRERERENKKLWSEEEKVNFFPLSVRKKG